MVSPGGGAYVVKESGLEFQHNPNDPNDNDDSTPTTPEIFLERFRNKFEMRILERPSPNELVFELKHVDTSFVNALRRILLAEVPTVALEHVYMWNNSSILHDEVLAHRLGLIPLNMDARLLDEPDDEDDTPTDRNTVVFRLAVACPKQQQQQQQQQQQDPNKRQQEMDLDNNEDHPEELVQQPSSRADLEQVETETAAAAAAAAAQRGQETKGMVNYPQDRPYTMHIYSKDLQWIPQGDQQERFADEAIIKPVHDDILIAKLRPGQSIELEAHGRRGIGKDHAKFSPVATASYRLMPHIELVEPVYDDLAQELVHVYEPGVFDLVPTDPAVDPPGTRQKARLVNPYACTMSRNYMRIPKLAQAIRTSRIPDHFIFSVESVGMYSPAVLVAEALRILQQKCRRVMDLADDQSGSSRTTTTTIKSEY